jgi:hypothetical protein
MIVELFYFDGCPSHEPLVEQLPEILARAGVDARVELRRVESDEDAQRLRFLGSPTIRIGGRDIEPGAEQREDFGLKCRLYRTPSGLIGLPPEQWIFTALGSETPADRASLTPTETLLLDRSTKDRLEDCPPESRRLHRRVLRGFAQGTPPSRRELERWAQELDVDLDSTLSALETNDVLRRDLATGTVALAYPFSATPTDFRVALDSTAQEVFAMCAVDALGIPTLAGRNARITSRDRSSGAQIEIQLEPSGAFRSEPHETVVVAAVAGEGPSASCCCPYISFASDRASAQVLLESWPGIEGEIVELPAAIDAGRRIFGALLEPATGESG